MINTKRTQLGFYYITESNKPSAPIKKFTDLFYACNSAAYITRTYNKPTTVYQYDKINNKPVKLTNYKPTK